MEGDESSSSNYDSVSTGDVPQPMEGATEDRKRKLSVGRAPPEKRQKLLEKNRQSARECRRRKKEKVQMLENQVQELSKQIHDMQAASAAPTKTQILHMRKQAIDGIGSILNDPGVASLFNRNKKAKLQDLEWLNSKMQPLLHQIHKLIGDKVIEPVEDYFNRIDDLLVPMDITKFIMWGLGQPEQFYEEGSGEGIWDLVVRELELTEQQKAELMKYRPVMSTLRTEFQSVRQRLLEASEAVKAWLNNIKTHLTEVQLMLTPMQQAKFLWWAEQNMPLLKTVESMWRNPSSSNFAPPPLHAMAQMYDTGNPGPMPAGAHLGGRAGMEGLYRMYSGDASSSMGNGDSGVQLNVDGGAPHAARSSSSSSSSSAGQHSSSLQQLHLNNLLNHPQNDDNSGDMLGGTPQQEFVFELEDKGEDSDTLFRAY